MHCKWKHRPQTPAGSKTPAADLQTGRGRGVPQNIWGTIFGGPIARIIVFLVLESISGPLVLRIVLAQSQDSGVSFRKGEQGLEHEFIWGCIGIVMGIHVPLARLSTSKQQEI